MNILNKITEGRYNERMQLIYSLIQRIKDFFGHHE